MPERAWIVLPDGVRRAVTAQGLLLGRAATCDVVVDEPRASGRHALLCLAASGVELHPLGRNTTRVNGKEVRGVRRLSDGDQVDIPGLAFRLERSGGNPSERAPVWMVRIGETLHRVPARPWTLGGGDEDEIRLDGWPPGALTLQVGGAALLAEASTATDIDGETLGAEDLRSLRSGQMLRIGSTSIEVLAELQQEETTVASLDSLRLHEVVFQYRPNGGELFLQLGDDRIGCSLSELRTRLVVVLLQPPGDYAAGDFVPDEVVISAVWPRRKDRTNFDVNTLVHRLRKDLLKRGLDPTRFIERSRTGGATRFRVAEARVTVT